MKVYKLTDESYQTYNNTQWGENVTHTASGKGELCGEGWLHCYIDPRLAVIMNPIHGIFDNPVLWEAEAEGVFKEDGQLKMGCTRLTTIQCIGVPEITVEQKIMFAIRCALFVYKEPGFVKWAQDWIDNVDRSRAAAWAAEAAWAAAEAARAAARAAAEAAKAAETHIDLLAVLDECGILKPVEIPKDGDGDAKAV